MEKWKVREECLSKRDSQSNEMQISKSREIFNKIFELEDYERSKVVMCYLDFRNEVITTEFIKEVMNHGKNIVVPKMVKNNTGSLYIKTFFITDIVKNLEIGKFFIREPKGNFLNEVLHCEIDLAVVPGVAFDKSRNRIGYGKGYYDKYFGKSSSSIVKIGIAYDFQIVDCIEPNDNDVKMDMIVTEKRIIF